MKALISILKGIKNGVSKGFRKVKGSKRLQGALLVVVVVSIGLTVGFGIYNKGKNDGSVIEKPVVCYQDIEDIAFQEATIKEIGKIHKPMELGKYEVDTFLTTSDYVFSYNAVIKAGYDLENIKDDGGNELTQTITVTLPKASILDSYLDEKSYIRAFIYDKVNISKIGPKKIKRELVDLKLPENIIDDELSSIDDEIFKVELEKQIQKRIAMSKNYSGNVLKQKIISYFMDKGYDKNMITSILDTKELYDEDALKKEYNKLYNKYSKKYSGKELEMIIKQKLYQKGFYQN